MAKFLDRWGPVVLWTILIFSLSSFPTLPKSQIIWWDFIIKKTAHMVEYAILFYVTLRALNDRSFKNIKLQTWIIAFTFCILYALSDEFHQTLVPGRTGKIRDIGFDTIGIILSSIFIKRTNK